MADLIIRMLEPRLLALVLRFKLRRILRDGAGAKAVKPRGIAVRTSQDQLVRLGEPVVADATQRAFGRTRSPWGETLPRLEPEFGAGAYGWLPEVWLTYEQDETKPTPRPGRFGRNRAGAAASAPPPSAELRATDRSDRRPLFDTATALIGRSDLCDVVIDDARVSRQHARVWCDGVRWWIAPEATTTNPLLVNGDTVEGAAVLSSGDVVGFGTKVSYRFVTRPPSGGDERDATAIDRTSSTELVGEDYPSAVAAEFRTTEVAGASEAAPPTPLQLTEDLPATQPLPSPPPEPSPGSEASDPSASSDPAAGSEASDPSVSSDPAAGSEASDPSVSSDPAAGAEVSESSVSSDPPAGSEASDPRASSAPPTPAKPPRLRVLDVVEALVQATPRGWPDTPKAWVLSACDPAIVPPGEIHRLWAARNQAAHAAVGDVDHARIVAAASIAEKIVEHLEAQGVALNVYQTALPADDPDRPE